PQRGPQHPLRVGAPRRVGAPPAAGGNAPPPRVDRVGRPVPPAAVRRPTTAGGPGAGIGPPAPVAAAGRTPVGPGPSPPGAAPAGTPACAGGPGHAGVARDPRPDRGASAGRYRGRAGRGTHLPERSRS